MKTAKNKLNVACGLMKWLVDMHAPDFRDTVRGDEPITAETRLKWLRRVDVPFLRVKTSQREPHQLMLAGVIESDGCGPAVLKISAKGEMMQCFLGYRLTALGRRWCAAATREDGPDRKRSLLLGMALQRAMDNPDHVKTLALRVHSHPAPDRTWAALILLGHGVTPEADPAELSNALVKNVSLIEETV
jgi:hypothetical protein